MEGKDKKYAEGIIHDYLCVKRGGCRFTTIGPEGYSPPTSGVTDEASELAPFDRGDWAYRIVDAAIGRLCERTVQVRRRALRRSVENLLMSRYWYVHPTSAKVPAERDLIEGTLADLLDLVGDECRANPVPGWAK